jgi:hypothetical protein
MAGNHGARAQTASLCVTFTLHLRMLRNLHLAVIQSRSTNCRVCRRDFLAMQGWWLPAAFLCAALASAAAEYFNLFLRAH